MARKYTAGGKKSEASSDEIWDELLYNPENIDILVRARLERGVEKDAVDLDEWLDEEDG